jgi:hypothetical protein
MKYVVSMICVFGLILVSPGLVRAENIRVSLAGVEKVEMLERISELLREVIRLQALLAEQQSFTREPYESVLFTVPMEAYYFVVGTELVPVSGTDTRVTDQVLFDLFIDTLGSDGVTEYVAEWRVFNDDELDIDAYVESIDDTGRYVLSINRSGFTTGREAVVDSYRKLFIHEYAHMLLFAEPGVIDTFTDVFWTAADIAHQERFAAAVGNRRTSLLNQYYNNHAERFVSDYATVAPEEDMAETFLFLVTEPARLRTTKELRDKIAFIQNVPFIATEIERLQHRYENR